jgi:hypothetical protein
MHCTGYKYTNGSDLIKMQYNIKKRKFEELSEIPTADNVIQFWKLLFWENFPNLRKFGQ